jgi:DNA-binding GntR family transcriptional regulator
MRTDADTKGLLGGATIERGILRDEIAQTLKQAILQGRLKPGQQLGEIQLATELQVSRAPLREAFWKLRDEGFVTKLPHKGAIVTTFTPLDIAETYSVRIVLEGLAARLIVEKGPMKESALAAMREALERLLKKVDDTDPEAFIAADYDFHQTLWRESGNQILERTLVRLCTPFFGYATINVLTKGRDYQPAPVAAAHVPILTALESSDPAEAERLVRENLSLFAAGAVPRPPGEESSMVS